VAKQDWIEHSDGLLTLVIQDAESTTGHRLLIVHAQHVPSNRTATLFSVVHRPGSPYPATIQPRDRELPDFLKKSYYKPGFADITAGIAGAAGREITNSWACETPFEFRLKLQQAFNLGMVKSEVLSLVSSDISSDVEDETSNQEFETNSDQESETNSDDEDA
jgi:hypothetical protein